MRTNTARLTALTSLALASGLALSACGDAGESGEDAEAADGITLELGEFNWLASEFQGAVITQIIEDYPELGISDVSTTQFDPAVGWTGLGSGDVDLLVDVIMPNHEGFAEENEDTVEIVSEVYGGAAQGWFIPEYAAEGELSGLESVDQLSDSEYADAVGNTLYDAEAGWVTTEHNAERLEGFDLDLEHLTSSEAALIAEVESHYSDEEPILFFFYQPHWLFSQLDLVQLDEPNEYNEDCFDGGQQDCASPELSGWTAAHTDLRDEAPEFVAMLEEFEIPLEDIEEAMLQDEDEDVDVEDLAADWVEENADTVESWVNG
ncbi:glycine betaine ABC transporter substrate-binding protein [Nesterenkonia sp. NBAIMH1]|uniref:glycine betaine ABC transporter substrate-binding protein n=1 Tax=Nesterenkonia sp. NBAIMH1 TaxID=2600320 RepID=UPI0011B4E769|nr:glycine betaine ABC transporter substrate-binding protein [Nesterenkonia sp. NBAIMH1]